MSEWRPHWDDDLISAVRAPLLGYGSDETICAVIAAVEDWQASTATISAVALLVKQAGQLRAVREASMTALHKAADAYLTVLDIRAALDGEQS